MGRLLFHTFTRETAREAMAKLELLTDRAVKALREVARGRIHKLPGRVGEDNVGEGQPVGEVGRSLNGISLPSQARQHHLHRAL